MKKVNKGASVLIFPWLLEKELAGCFIYIEAEEAQHIRKGNTVTNKWQMVFTNSMKCEWMFNLST